MKNNVEFNMRIVTRQEIEANRTDYNRFELPEDYTTEEHLMYFKEEFNRRMFVDYYWYNKLFSNETMLALAKLSTPDVSLKWKVLNP